MGLLGDGVVPEPVEEAPVEGQTTEAAPEEVRAEPATILDTVELPTRPEYLDEQFWDADKGEPNVQGLAKSYKDLRTEFNKRNNDKVGETAEDYATKEFFLQEGMESMKEDPAMMQAFAAAKEAGLGVKQAQTFINNFMGGMEDFKPQQVDVQAELAKLGKNGPHVVSGIKTWIDGMQKQGHLNDEVHSELLKLGSTAAGIKALDVLMHKSGEMNIPAGKALNGTSHMSAQDWYAATYDSHAEAGESKEAFNVRMRSLGETIFGTGHGTFNGTGFMPGGNR